MPTTRQGEGFFFKELFKRLDLKCFEYHYVYINTYIYILYIYQDMIRYHSLRTKKASSRFLAWPRIGGEGATRKRQLLGCQERV